MPSRQETLERAIELAIENGWDDAPSSDAQIKELRVHDDLWVPTYLYSHDFAKALWGFDTVTVAGEKRLRKPLCWEYHLQQVVIAPDPTEYLAQNLP